MKKNSKKRLFIRLSSLESVCLQKKGAKMTNYERYFSDINAIAKLLASCPCPIYRPLCIYHNGAYCDPELRSWGKTRTCEEGILAWLNTEEVSGDED